MSGVSQSFAHFALTGARCVACIAGFIAFYVAFFMYEDEEGNWQNRLEALWVSIDDRARVTDSKFTALINKSANTLLQLSNRIFGKRLFSLQMVSVSANLSVALSLLALMALPFIAATGLHLAIKWSLVLSLLPHFMKECALCLFCGIVAIRHQRRFILLLTFLPIVLFAGIPLLGAILDTAGPFAVVVMLQLDFMFAVILSVFTDVLAIAFLRRIFINIARNISMRAILKSVVSLIVTCAAAEVLPLVGFRLFVHGLGGISFFLTWLIVLNLTTVVYCLIPAVILVGLLVHKLIWPVLGKAVYPLARFKLLTNRPAMAGIGGLAFTFAITGQLAIDELLKLFK